MARPAVLSSLLIEIFRTHHLLSANELSALVLGTAGKKYNKTSIYRALEKLESEGTICKHSFSSEETKFELRESHHDHLVCSRCGTIQTADCQIEVPVAIGGFKADHHHLTIFGLCADCQKT